MIGQVTVFFVDGTAEQFPVEFDKEDMDAIADMIGQSSNLSEKSLWLKTQHGAVMIPDGRVKYIEWREVHFDE